MRRRDRPSDARRVCIVGSLAPPPGGVATYCAYLVAGLSHHGWQVTFADTRSTLRVSPVRGLRSYHPAAPRRNLLASLNPTKGVSIRNRDRALTELVATLPLKERVRVIGLRDRLSSILRRQPVEVVHGMHAGVRSLGALWAAKLSNSPFMLTVFGSEFVSPALQTYLPVARFVCTRADTVVAISKHSASVARKAGVDRPIEIVYPGIDFARYEQSRVPAGFHKRYGLRRGVPIVLYAGALIERKGPQVLLAALNHLPEAVRRVFEVVLIGPDLGLRKHLELTVKRNRWSSVHVVGEVPPAAVPAFYRAADIFVFPTITQDEGFGLVAVEAAAAGCAIIASRIGAIPEVVAEEKNALLFSPGNAVELAQSLQQLLSDAPRRAGLQRASPSVAKRFSWESTALNMHKLCVNLARTLSVKHG